MSKPSQSLGFLAVAIIISGMTIIDYYKYPSQETQETLEKMELPVLQNDLYRIENERY